MNTINNQERRAANRAEQCQTRHGPKDEFEIKVISDVFVAVDFRNSHGENCVAGHPDYHYVCTYSTVVIFLELGFCDGWDGNFDSVAEVS